MPRRSLIHDKVKITVLDPDTGAETEHHVTFPQALCKLLEAGSHLENAAAAMGLGKRTIFQWIARGREHMPAGFDEMTEEERERALAGVAEGERPFVLFSHEAERARARGIVWHELNVTRGAREDPRLSLEFLARRQPQNYSKRLEIDTEPADRDALPLDPVTVEEIEESFAADLPPEVEPRKLLPQLPPGDDADAS